MPRASHRRLDHLYYALGLAIATGAMVALATQIAWRLGHTA